MHPIIQSPRDRQLILGSGVRVQSAGHTAGGIESAYAVNFVRTSNQGVAIPTAAQVRPTAALTVSAWIKQTTSNTGFIFDNQGLSPYRGFCMLTVASKLLVNVAYNVNATDVAGTTTLSLNTWYHVAFTWDGSECKLYVNGSVDKTQVLSGPLTYDVSPPQLAIGIRHTMLVSPFDGLIDDLRIYNRALDAPEISSIYANIASPPTDGLVAYFPLDEGTGTTTIDEIAGLIGTLTNGPTWSTDVPAALQ